MAIATATAMAVVKICERGSCSFFWLPAELRTMVYEDLLIRWKIRHKLPSEASSCHSNCPGCTSRIYPEILRTSKEIYYESMAVLYGKNCFHIGLRSGTFGQELGVPETLYPGFPSCDVLRRVTFTVYINRDEAHVVVECLRRMTKELNPAATLKVILLSSRLPNAINYLMGVFLEAIKLYSFLAGVELDLKVKHHGKELRYLWPRRQILNLESSLGPNLSKEQKPLHFRPSSKSIDWEKLHVSPLLRLPVIVREKIFSLVFERALDEGEKKVIYPSAKQQRTLDRSTIWFALNKTNPKLNFSLAQTCHQFADEALKTIFASNTIVFHFDYSKDAPHIESLPLPASAKDYLFNVRIHIQDCGDHMTIDESGYIADLLGRLVSARNQYDPDFDKSRLERNLHVVIRLQKKETRDFTDEEFMSRPDPCLDSCIDIPGHDYQLAFMLTKFTLWDRVVVTFADVESRNNWRPIAIEILEKHLGIDWDISGNGMNLEFHPRLYMISEYRKHGCFQPVHHRLDFTYYSGQIRECETRRCTCELEVMSAGEERRLLKDLRTPSRNRVYRDQKVMKSLRNWFAT